MLIFVFAPFAALALGMLTHPLGLARSGGAVRSRVELYRRPAEKAAQKEGIPVELLMGLVAAESGGRRNVTSSAGAVGLTQVLPSTARGEAVRMGLLAPESLDLYDPVINLHLGAAYLSRQLGTFRGDRHLALSAYHSGPGKPLGWRKTDASAAGDELLRLHGTPRTRAYVQRVLEMSAWFAEPGEADTGR
ncbi:MAG: lytic transglycosylase domain-containing protein [Planctomycetota bacterium]|jgi:soluble lytic murein transglycosylase